MAPESRRQSAAAGHLECPLGCKANLPLVQVEVLIFLDNAKHSLMSKIVDWDGHIGRRLRLRDLRVFEAVVQSGSLAKAAAQLRVTQPAVSQVIAELEQNIGVKLFDRGRRGVEPTVYAHALLSRSRAAFDELKQGLRDIEFLADAEAGELRIGSTTSTTNVLLSPLLHRFTQRYPRVVVHIEEVPRLTMDVSALRDRKLDLILGRLMMPVTDTAMGDLRIESLFHDQLVVAAGRRNRWARRRKIDLAELADEPWMMPPADSWSYRILAEAFTERGMSPPKLALVAFSAPLRTYLLAHGPHLTALASSTVLLDENRRLLKILPVDLPARPWHIAVLRLANRTLSPVVDRFVECAREVARTIAAEPARRPRPKAGSGV
jgi:DNA-binding transcriptional LysR family regulator